MKAIKISLAVFVITAISIGTIFWIQSIKDPENVKDPENQFIIKIEREIEQLKAKPDSEFCKVFYQEVKHNINVFYEQNRFDSNQSVNNQLKENLENTLYSVYSEKFIKQAKTFFRGSEWNTNDLKFIQSENNELRRSRFLSSGSPVDQEFATIQIVLNKYNEIVSFISSCKGFSYSGTALLDRFPIADAQSKIQRAVSLRNNRLENEFVNNCTRLHNDLKEIPQILFRAHVRYLDSKVTHWSGMYSNYNSQSDYANNLYRPLKAEVDGLDNDIYNVSNFISEYNRLTQKLDSDSQNAYIYFSNKR
ncbi:hypothetical protein IH575_04615 [Candidatus Dojkabacteria bacterium]|nr:hypothetical protein [Candidatus Dojkabacteria bacterium]